MKYYGSVEYSLDGEVYLIATVSVCWRLSIVLLVGNIYQCICQQLSVLYSGKQQTQYFVCGMWTDRTGMLILCVKTTHRSDPKCLKYLIINLYFVLDFPSIKIIYAKEIKSTC